MGQRQWEVIQYGGEKFEITKAVNRYVVYTKGRGQYVGTADNRNDVDALCAKWLKNNK